ncbi:MAG TPA: wax ester/triacylglycerol synthase family O-acyltransferase [Acidimicrobiales bacterium]|nr:wax ester/triacylglycerol synthase family O-acyltransferase [Acidimicrobiales bacterium]
MTTMQRLSALDASFLALETPVTPMHVGCLATFDGAPMRGPDGRVRIDDIRKLADERLALLPRFRQRIVRLPGGRPMWADDPDFDVSYHVRAATLPAPGTEAQLRQLAEHLHMELLDRSRPLWELWYVDGLQDGRVALIEKVHHCLMDGVSGVDVAAALMDVSPEVRRLPDARWFPEPAPGVPGLEAVAATRLAAAPLGVAGWAWEKLRNPADTVKAAVSVARGLGTVLRYPPIAGSSSLNRRVDGRRRRFEVAHLSVPEAKRIRTALGGGTVNDVILASVAGGLREMLLARGEPVEGVALQTLVPVSVRDDAHRGALGNQVAAMFVPLPLGGDDHAARYRQVRAATDLRKSGGQAAFSRSLLASLEHLPSLLLDAATPLVHRQPFVNLVVTNVPGPQVPLYTLGARMLDVAPIVPIARNLDLSVGIFSYDGTATLGIWGDADLCPDLALLAEGTEKAFAVLGYLADEASR